MIEQVFLFFSYAMAHIAFWHTLILLSPWVIVLLKLYKAKAIKINSNFCYVFMLKMSAFVSPNRYTFVAVSLLICYTPPV
jgi:hypothetical protein